MNEVSYSRRKFATFAGAGTLLAVTGVVPAAAQAQFPIKPITIVVIASGGSPDIFSRFLAPRMSQILGQTVIVDPKPGAAGNVAAAIVARAEPDGHTILMHSALLAISPSLNKSLPFSPTKDLTPLSQIATTEMLVLVRAESPIKSLAELIAAAKAQPGKLNFASAGNGTIVHLAGEMLKLRTGTDMVHVPYKGSVPGLMALMAGEVQVSVDVMPVALTHIKSGRLRALAIASPSRSSSLPDVPTTAEAGVPGFEVGSWNGFFMPAKTPPAVMEKLHAAIVDAMSQPQVRSRMSEMGAVPMATSQQEFQRFFNAEVSRFAQIVREANITAE